jgi:hypothetical protein
MGSARARSFIAQPSRSGSTKVSIPTFVSTPGRCPAPSRSMSKTMPDGTFQAGISLPVIIRQIRGGSAFVGPDG